MKARIYGGFGLLSIGFLALAVWFFMYESAPNSAAAAAVVLFIAACVIAAIVASAVVKPIDDLAKAVEKIENGELTGKINYAEFDEELS